VASLIVLQDGTLAVVAPLNSNFAALNNEVRGVDRGGTGANSLTPGALLVGNGTSPIATVVGNPGQVLVIPGGGGNPDFIDMVHLPSNLTLNGVLLGQGTADIIATAAGTYDDVFAVPQAGGVPAFRARQSGFYSFIRNGDFEIWPGAVGGATFITPLFWSQSSAANVERVAGVISSSSYAVRLTRAGGTNCTLTQDMWPGHPIEASVGGNWFTAGCWVNASTAGQATISLSDGVNTSQSPAHSGSGGWEWLQTPPLQGSLVATTLSMALLVASFNGAVTFDGATCVLGRECRAWAPGKPVLQAGFYNYAFNGDMEIWGGGTTSVPTGWVLVGAGATVARNTAAGGFVTGTASMGLTRAGADTVVYQNVAAIAPPVSQYRGRTFTAGAWVYADAANRVVLTINDGVGTANIYHPGDSQWRWLQTTRTVDNAATTLQSSCYVINSNGTGYFDGVTLVEGEYVPQWLPSGWRGRKSVLQFSSGSTNANTYYGLGVTNASEAAVAGPIVPFRGVARNFYANTSGAPLAADACRLRASAADTALVFNFLGGVASGSNTTTEVELAQGVACDIRTTTTTMIHSASIEFEEIPASFS